MAVCYFNSDYKKRYTCIYTVTPRNIEVTVDYDVLDEIPSENGMQVISSNTEYAKRDILIIDYESKRNILVKQAHFAGHADVFGTPDESTKTKFRGHLYFEHADFNLLAQLPLTPKIEKFKVFSKSLLRWIGRPSLTKTNTDELLEFSLSKRDIKQEATVECNGISKISISDDWKTQSSSKSSITIEFSGVIEVEPITEIDYDTIYDFIYELVIFMQPYSPDEFEIDKIEVTILGTPYRLTLPAFDYYHGHRNIRPTVDGGLLNFLMRCYQSIPYRHSKQEIRNIPYIVLKTSRGLEDNFLMFYRFIECYYKQIKPAMRSAFISQSIIEHYSRKEQWSDQQFENYTQEIICLRNHYAHAGYFIENASLDIVFKQIKGKANPKNYTANGVDVNWIYERTKILYQIVLDIIFKDMLDYSTYRFDKHF